SSTNARVSHVRTAIVATMPSTGTTMATHIATTSACGRGGCAGPVASGSPSVAAACDGAPSAAPSAATTSAATTSAATTSAATTSAATPSAAGSPLLPGAGRAAVPRSGAPA